MKLGEQQANHDIEVIPAGVIALDVALGIGGYPKGRIIEIYGHESSGKTTLTLLAIEHALDPKYAKLLGVDVDNLIVSQPDTGEQALEIADMLVRSGGVDIVVVDSVAALTPKAEIEGDMGDSHMGLQARLMSQALRKLTANIKRSNTLVMFINQIRMKIGVMFGNPETTTGGNALKFYSSVRLEVRKGAVIKDGDVVNGNAIKVKIVKNKVAPPFRQCEFELIYGEGISLEAELVDLGAKHGIVEKSGAWYSYNGSKIGQGKEKSKDYLKENTEIRDEIERKLLELLMPHKYAKETQEPKAPVKSETKKSKVKANTQDELI
ncbi:UNVERIFIED_CONTAM: hypothetical protein GTU68_061978 [Idotea baltica]|nr:hypothetical protein [Idotea baltica]